MIPQDDQPRPRDRKATEQALVDACERIFLRDGADGIGVNKVVKEAGVGKDLIYRYFGGLPGLIKKWFELRDIWPTYEELIGGDEETFRALNIKKKVETVHLNYLRSLRSRPIVMQILASEMLSPTEITAALDHRSDQLARSVTLLFEDLTEQDMRNVADISMLLYSTSNYVAMRAHKSPEFYGMDLHDDAAWENIERVMREMIDRFYGDM